MTEDNIENPADQDESSVLGTIVDAVSDSTLPAPIKKNFFKAFGQLCTSAVEIPVAYLEGIANEKRAESLARVALIEKSANEIAQQMEFDPEYARAAVKKFGQRVVREQLNLDRVTAKAAESLSESDAKDEQETPEISDDWLNAFEKEASQKSTEEMQAMFGKALAGEITSPDSFSIKSVKLLGELDSKTAALFQTFCSASMSLEVSTQNGGIHILDARVCSLSGNAGSNSISQYGLSFDQLNILHEYGLIIPDYNCNFDYKFAIAKQPNQPLIPFTHQGEQWVLLSTGEPPPPNQLKISGVGFSKAGKELSKVVDISPQKAYTQALIEYFEKKNLKMVRLPKEKT